MAVGQMAGGQSNYIKVIITEVMKFFLTRKEDTLLIVVAASTRVAVVRRETKPAVILGLRWLQVRLSFPGQLSRCNSALERRGKLASASPFTSPGGTRPMEQPMSVGARGAPWGRRPWSGRRETGGMLGVGAGPAVAGLVAGSVCLHSGRGGVSGLRAS